MSAEPWGKPLLPEGTPTVASPPVSDSRSRSRPLPIRLVAGPTPELTDELTNLLRSRLRVAGLIVLVAEVLSLLACYFSDFYREGMAALDFLVLHGALGLIGAVVMILFLPRPLAQRQLRGIEVMIFATATAAIGWEQWRWLASGWLQGLAAPGQEDKVLLLAGDSLSSLWFALIVLYGMFIPNTWRRCTLVVALMAGTPVVLLAVQGGSLLLLGGMTLWMGIAAAMAVLGCHKINVLRHEAFTARQLGQYRLLRRLGAGGMGEVYLAEHQLLRRPCALKLIHPHQVHEPDALPRFEREVCVTATLTHPNTVAIYDYGRAEDGTFYYVMEYLPGLSLQEMVDRHGPLPAGRVVHLLRQVCGALAEAHSVGLIHRDIKPSNIIVCQRGGVADVAKLLDFGLVSQCGPASGPQLTLPGMVVGTPLYMSPEQAAGKPLDARSDIYSLGAAAYFLLTGRPPFDTGTVSEILADHIRTPVVAPRAQRADVPGDLEAVVLRCLEKTPERRFTDAAELEQALAQCHCAGNWSPVLAATWWRENGQRTEEAPRAQPSTTRSWTVSDSMGMV